MTTGLLIAGIIGGLCGLGLAIFSLSPTKATHPTAPSLPTPCAAARYAGCYERCVGVADKRCKGGNCTAHCRDYCGGTCLAPVGTPGSLRSVK